MAQMTIDEYREHLVGEITELRNQKAAQDLITEADTNLRNNDISRDGQTRFWRELNADLEAAEARSWRLLEKQAADALSQVIAAARAVIAQHQARMSSSGR